MILTIATPHIKTSLTVEGWKKHTAIRNVMEKYAKKQVSIAQRGLVKTSTFITVVDFSDMIHRWELASWNINIVWPSVQLVGVFDSIPHFSLPVEIVFVLVFFLFRWSLFVPILTSALLEMFHFFYWHSPFIQLICTDFLHTHNRLLKKSII